MISDEQILEIAFNHRPIKTNDDLITFALAIAAAQREEDAIHTLPVRSPEGTCYYPDNKEPACNPDPRAPHGFDRNASHSEGRYVCECEFWNTTEPAHQETAKHKYDRFMQESEEPSAVERLRFFCSLAMTGQDWLDVEPFFNALEPAHQSSEEIGDSGLTGSGIDVSGLQPVAYKCEGTDKFGDYYCYVVAPPIDSYEIAIPLYTATQLREAQVRVLREKARWFRESSATFTGEDVAEGLRRLADELEGEGK